MLYRFDENTKEYLWTMAACLDPLESEKQGRAIYVTPPFCTTITVPEVQEHEVAVFNETLNTWEVKKDFRGTAGFNKKTGEPVFIEELGELPENFVNEKPVFIQDLKVEKFSELRALASHKQDEEVEYLGVKGNLDLRVKLNDTLNSMGGLAVTTYLTKDNEAISLTKENLEQIQKYFTLRGILIPIITSELAKEIRRCRSKKQLEELELDFKLEERTRELINLSNEEIENYIEEHTK